MMAVRAPVAGFTLVEMLVALLIFALLSAAGVALLAFGIDGRARSAQRLDTLAAVTRSRALLTADLAQAAPRPWRDSAGARQPAFASGGAVLIGVVRRGWRNDSGAPRASLQRVAYRLVDGRLERATAPMVDGAAETAPAVLLRGVGALQLRFHSAGQWRDRWQPATADALPDAVELTLAADGVPALRQVFLVGAGPAA